MLLPIDIDIAIGKGTNMYKQVLPAEIKKHSVVLKSLNFSDQQPVMQAASEILVWPVDQNYVASSEWLKYN